MKNLLLFTFCLFLSASLSAQDNSHFGKKINEKSAIAADQLADKMGDKASIKTKVSGTVDAVCQAKGCWMTVKLDNGETMRVTFKDYGFFVPKDIAGKTVVFEGLAQKKVTPASELRHYAEDAGKSKEEVAKITEDKNEFAFVAEGVIVK